MKSLASQGICPEAMWPYHVQSFASKPDAACYTSALQHRTVQYRRVPQDLVSLKSCLAGGYPFVLGITVFQSFESDAVAKTGRVPMPSANDQELGGHAVMAVGYSDASQRFLIRNSWGPKWGINGYFTLPYEYVTNTDLTSDLWTIRFVE
ncbi:MAG: C1 family peptidase [Acidobacteriaceae bacterium]|nr:C1 family peptidase [Acidobacteriaceae bacterium]